MTMPNIAVMRAASEIVARSILAARAGITFSGARDLYETLGYKRELKISDYRGRYERGGIAARVVEAFPKATWRGGAELVEDEDPEIITQFEETWTELNKRLGVWSSLAQTDILAGLGRYAVLLIGAPGKISDEMPRKLTTDQIVYLTSYAEDEAEIVKWDEDTASERFGLPVLYQIKRELSSNSSTRRKSLSFKAHWTRVLHVADGLVEDRVFGQPRLKRVWNYFDDLEKVSGGGAEAFWRRVHQGMVFNLDKDTKLDPTEIENVRTAADEMVHDLRRVMATRGMELKMLGSDVANYDKQVDSILTLIAGATEIPKRILMGSEMGELASSQDEGNWNVRVGDRRQTFAEPVLVRPFVKLLMDHGALPEIDQYDVRWPEVDPLDDNERADVAVKWSELNTKAGDTVVTAAEIRDRVLRLDKLTEEQLTEIEDKKAQAMAEQQEIMKQQASLKNGDQPDDEEDQQEPPKAATSGKAQPPVAPGFRRINRIADASRGKIARLMEQAVSAGRESIDMSFLTQALEDRSLGRVEFALEPASTRIMEEFAEVEQALLGIIMAVGRSANSETSIRALTNTCHDPNTGQFCGPGTSEGVSHPARMDVADVPPTFHFTTNERAEKILEEGFKPRDEDNLSNIGSWGVAVYLTTSPSGDRAIARSNQARLNVAFKPDSVVLRANTIGEADALLDHFSPNDPKIRDGMLKAGVDAIYMRHRSMVVVYNEKKLSVSRDESRSLRALDLGVNLTRTNPEAAHWAKTRSSTLIVEISESTRVAIRRIMHLAFVQHIPPRETARLLADLVGLTEDQAEAVWAFRQELLDSPGRLVRRARTTVRVPTRGISAELLAKRVREYSQRLLRHRTLNIARTETIAASNEGQRQVWLQAVENKLISPEVEREWIAAPGERTCPICKALDGQTVGLEERFVLPDGTKVMGPPAHPSCRCGQGLTPASLRAASNPCHDPNTGEFCEIGGGKTGGLSSGVHPHASEGRKMVRGWVSDSSSKVAVSLKHGVRDELGAKGTVYDPEKTTSRINEKERVAGRRGARAIYETTQAKMIESGIPEEVVLYRGVTKTRTKRNVIESWTSDPNVAKEFGPTVIKQTFKRSQILAFHGSPIWSRQYQGEQEFVVMPGLS